jgi:hypothetical protein
MSRLPHFLDKRLINGGEVVGLGALKKCGGFIGT